jgi:hypothetical protein
MFLICINPCDVADINEAPWLAFCPIRKIVFPGGTTMFSLHVPVTLIVPYVPGGTALILFCSLFVAEHVIETVEVATAKAGW